MMLVGTFRRLEKVQGEKESEKYRDRATKMQKEKERESHASKGLMGGVAAFGRAKIGAIDF